MKNELLTQARIKRRWSVDYAAKRIGVSRSTYLRWENKQQIPHDASLMLVCKAFDLPPEQLGFAKAAIPEPTTEVFLSSENTVTAERLAVSSFLMQNDDLVNSPGIVYDKMIQEVLGCQFQWKRLPNFVLELQQPVRAVIGKYDAMQQENTKSKKITRRAALGTIAMFPVHMYGLSMVTSATRITPPPEELLPLCASGLAACHELRQYEHEGMQTIRRILAAYLPTLEKMAQQTSSHQYMAAALATQGYLLASNVADHYGKLDQMEAAARMARHYAQVAQDPNLEVASLNRLAIRFSFGNQEARAMEVYHEIVALPGFAHVSPLLRGRVYAGLASTSSSCHRVSDALVALGNAKDIWPDVPEADPSFHFAVNKTPRLALWEGLTLAGTGKFKDASKVFAQFGRLEPVAGLRESSRSEYLNYNASVAANLRDLEAAVAYLGAAEDIARTIHNEQRLAETHTTLNKLLLLWPNESKILNLQEKMYAQ